MHHLKKLLFMFCAALLVSGAAYLQHLADLRQERLDLLNLEIVELTESYENQIENLQQLYEHTAGELKETQLENYDTHQELNKTLEQIEVIEKRNRQLEHILFNQQQTYRNAVALNGSTMNALSTSDFTARQYERAWSRLGAHGLLGTGPALLRAEETYGVNSLILAAIAYHESGGGMSKIAREKHNLFGLGAFDSSPYLSAISFPTKDDSIYFAARLLRNSYLSSWGRNYRGDNLAAIGVSYASDPLWAAKIGNCMSMIARAAIPEGR